MNEEINDLPLPSENQIEQIADRIGTAILATDDVSILRLCSLIIYQDVRIAQLEGEKK